MLARRAPYLRAAGRNQGWRRLKHQRVALLDQHRPAVVGRRLVEPARRRRRAPRRRAPAHRRSRRRALSPGPSRRSRSSRSLFRRRSRPTVARSRLRRPSATAGRAARRAPRSRPCAPRTLHLPGNQALAPSRWFMPVTLSRLKTNSTTSRRSTVSSWASRPRPRTGSRSNRHSHHGLARGSASSAIACDQRHRVVDAAVCSNRECDDCRSVGFERRHRGRLIRQELEILRGRQLEPVVLGDGRRSAEGSGHHEAQEASAFVIASPARALARPVPPPR